jgi:pimeloyl-ACP methyl ester carboxylesterase
VVGGLSMGAVTALRFALAHPERVQALVLAGFPPGPDVAESLTARAREFADAIERDGLEAAGARFVWGRGTSLDPAAARLVRQGFLEHPPHGLAHTLRGVIAVQPSLVALAPELAHVAAPALVIVGGTDRLSLAPSRALADAMRDARLAVVEGAGHVVNLAGRDAFNAAVREFLGAVLH